jgi:hypothetical protein
MRNRRSIEHFGTWLNGKSLCSGFSVIERTKGWSVKLERPWKGFPFKHLRGPLLLWTRPKYVVSAFYIRWRFFTTWLRQPFLEIYQKGLSFCCRSVLCTTKPIESKGRLAHLVMLLCAPLTTDTFLLWTSKGPWIQSTMGVLSIYKSETLVIPNGYYRTQLLLVCCNYCKNL